MRCNSDGVASCLSGSSKAPEPYVFDGGGWLKYQMIGLVLFGFLGSAGFVMVIVNLSLDEISITFG